MSWVERGVWGGGAGICGRGLEVRTCSGGVEDRGV